MSHTVYPPWVFALVAFAIALAAFFAGQLVEGLGMITAGAGSAIWTAIVVLKGRMAGGVYD